MSDMKVGAMVRTQGLPFPCVTSFQYLPAIPETVADLLPNQLVNESRDVTDPIRNLDQHIHVYEPVGIALKDMHICVCVCVCIQNHSSAHSANTQQLRIPAFAGRSMITSTKFDGNRPLRPPISPSYHCASIFVTSLMMSPGLKERSSACVASYCVRIEEDRR